MMRERLGNLTSMRVEVGGLSWHVRASTDPVPADAPVVVMVHGLGVASRHMVPTARRLAPSCRVYAPDLPGFGASDHPDRALDVPELADALVAWLDTMGLARIPLVADSFGCQVVADLALRHPERVGRLALISPTIDPRARTPWQTLWRAALDQPREFRSEGGRVARAYLLEIGPLRALRTFRYALRDRIEEKLPQIHQPALVVRGARDPLVPQRWAEEAARLLPCGRLVVIPGAAHKLNYGRAPQLARVLRPFLRPAGAAAPRPGTAPSIARRRRARAEH